MAALEESLAAVKARSEPEAERQGEGRRSRAAKKTPRSPSRSKAKGKQVEVEGRELALTNLDKVLWPARPAFTKGEAIDYYARVAAGDPAPPAAAPLTRVRFPDGVEGQRFFEKRAPKHTPDWVHTAPIEMGTRRACSTSSSATTCRR